MGVFEDIPIKWEGRDYTIPADHVMQCIAKVEDVLTLAELATANERGAPPLGKISMAFAAVLRHAGARLTDADVYGGMFKGANPRELQARAEAAINVLLCMMLPPETLRAAAKDSPGKARAASSSSKKPIKRR